MAATPLIIALIVLTASILVLLILWVSIRYAKDRRGRARSCSQTEDPPFQLEHNIAYVAGNSESRVNLHCTYQPSGAPHAHSHNEGEELQSVTIASEERDVDKAEVWLKRGTSRDNLRNVGEGENILGAKTVRGWDMMGRPREDGLEGAGRR